MERSLAARAMTLARFMIVAVALAAGILMMVFPTVEDNLRINAAVALVNPVLLTLINLVGVSGMAGKVPVYKLGMITLGALFVVYGTI